MTTRTITRMFVIVVAAIAMALLGAEGDAAAVKKQNPEKPTLAKAGAGGVLHARKGKKRRGRAKKKRPKKKKRKAPEKKPDEATEEAGAEEAVPEEAPAPEAAPSKKAGPGGVGSKLRNSAAGSSLEPAPSLGAEGVPMTAGTGLRQSNRMEFDARVVRGETAGSGAVILFERGPRTLAPLTKKRTRFLDDTIEGVLGKEEAVKARAKIDRARKRKPSKKEKKSDKPAEEKPEKKSESNGKSK